MRTVARDPAGDHEMEGYSILDWKDSPHAVLEAVDDLLGEFGLEIVQVATGEDCYAFRLERRTSP